MISDTGRVRRGGGTDCGGELVVVFKAGFPGVRRRRNRFAFSRGPASFLSIELRRLCFGNCSSTWVVRREDLVRMRLENDKGSGEASGVEAGTWGIM